MNALGYYILDSEIIGCSPLFRIDRQMTPISLCRFDIYTRNSVITITSDAVWQEEHAKEWWQQVIDLRKEVLMILAAKERMASEESAEFIRLRYYIEEQRTKSNETPKQP